MTATPNRIAQTSREVQRDYKKHGPRLSEFQQRQLERAVVLEGRAAKAREQEERRKQAKKRREEKERKDKDVRRQLGVGLATQLIGFNHTQAQLKNGMEAFLGLKKRDAEEEKREAEMRKKIEEIVAEVEKEPWDDDDSIDAALNLPGSIPLNGDHCFDDDLDDDILLEAHDSILSDTANEIAKSLPTVQPPPPPAPVPVPATPEPSMPKENPEFTRLHGWANPVIERYLEELPGPLVELLSQDISTNLPKWDPASALLYKLNPVGVPPHRLRIKVGCVVILLRDLNASSQSSKSSHLRILRVEPERLECMVLDGQLEGTKSFLTPVDFPAKYRNEDCFSFSRTQFPVRVAVDFSSLTARRGTLQSGFKLPSIAGQPPRSGCAISKPHVPPSNEKRTLNRNPSFKLPGLPASKSTDLKVPPKLQTKPEPASISTSYDDWDDFLESGTQIARELSEESKTSSALKSNVQAVCPLSVQDFDFTLDDLDEVSKSRPRPKPIPTKDMLPVKARTRLLNPPSHSLKRASISTQQSPTKSALDSQICPAHQSNLKRAFSSAEAQPPSKRLANQSSKPVLVVRVTAQPLSFGSFSEFGISTQDAASFFDDDEDLSFGTPPINV